MKQLKAIITGGKDDFGIFFMEDLPVSGAGSTVEEAKESLQEGIKLLQEENNPENIPEELKGEYEIIYTFDMAGALKYYSSFMSYAGIAKITGVHQKQLSNYANGFRNPNKETAEKILNSLHRFAKELSQVQIIF